MAFPTDDGGNSEGRGSNCTRLVNHRCLRNSFGFHIIYAPFRNYGDSKTTWVENRGQILHFFCLCKI